MARRRSRRTPGARTGPVIPPIYPPPTRVRYLWTYRCQWIEEGEDIVRGENIYEVTDESATNYQRASYHARQLALANPPECVGRMMSGRAPLTLRLRCRRVGDVLEVPAAED